jgi:ATP-dependent 26S proteasome regulatory subunit
LEEHILTSFPLSANLETTFNDVCIPDKIKDSLRTTVSLPLLHPSAFKFGILGREAIGGVLLYGPPGTGKTMVCRALARECGARMLQLKPSDIMDSYVGESEKLVKSVFVSWDNVLKKFYTFTGF